MGLHKHFFMFSLCISMAMAVVGGTRPMHLRYDTPPLSQRLQVEGNNSSGCWESMFQLQSCTSEVIVFFLNGETFLGPECCSAIRVIENQCWPAMLASLGFTLEETDVLRHYCDAADAPPLPPTPPPPPPPHPVTGSSSSSTNRRHFYVIDQP